MSSHVAIAGATGAVGQEFVRILEERDFPHDQITFLASHRSAGKEITYRGQAHTIQELTEASFKGVDLALFSAGGSISKQFAPIAVKTGTVVVDNSSAFRMQSEVPLVVPEINAEDIRRHEGIIANPNCSTIIMNMPVWPLHKVNPVRRIVMSTYQAVSGIGAKAMAELTESTRAALEGRSFEPKEIPHPAAFNVWSHGSEIGEDGYNLEERKTWRETRKIFHCDDIRVTATCIRVPVMRAHCEAINLEFTNPITEAEVREILSAAPGVKIVDDRERNYFPMPLDASGQDDILVGRIRQDVSQPDGRGIDMFISGDQLRKGAALNAIQIAEHLAQ
jgi:aspartate-semialdehyde dehydrogenase